MSAPRLLFVCLGNICRSPLVEAVARRRCAEAGLDVMVASCGTGSWHVGKGADARMRHAAETAGFDLAGHRARQFQRGDLEAFHLVLAMDRDNLYGVERLVTPQSSAEIGLFLEWAAAAPPAEFPDPYYGEEKGFTEAVALAERGVAGLIERLRSR